MSLLGLFSQGDFVTRLVALLLLVMSVSSWVVILWKSWLLQQAKVDVAHRRGAGAAFQASEGHLVLRRR